MRLVAAACFVGALIANPARASTLVGVLSDGPSPYLEAVVESLEAELVSLVGEEEVTLRRFDGTWSVESIRRGLAEARQTQDLRLLVTLGPVSESIVFAAPSPRPVVAALGTPAPSSTEEGLVHVIAPIVLLEREVARIGEILPATRVGIAIDASWIDSAPMVRDYLRRIQSDLRVTLVPVPVDENGGWEAPNDLSALIWSHALRVGPEARRKVFQEALAARLPVMDALDPDGVKEGALLSTVPRNASTLRGREIALAIQALLKGEPPPDFEPLPERLLVNTEVAKRLGIGIPFEVLSEARVIAPEERRPARTLTLDETSERALKANPGLAAARQNLAAGEQSVRVARSGLLPQAEVGVDAQWIDEDRAAGPFPPAERQMQFVGEATQSIFSAEAWRVFETEDQRQRAREATFRASELDVVGFAGRDFLEVLRRLAAERIQRENLERTRVNLSLARIRRRIGVANRDEVFRFEIEVVQSKRGVIEAVAERNRSEITLNILLGESPERPFEAGPLEPGDFLAVDDRLAPYMDDPVAFRKLRAYAEKVSLENAPEVQAARANRKAAERDVTGFQQALFIPRFDLVGNLTQRFLTDGAGTNGGDVGFPVPDDFDWQVGVAARLPLFAGFERYGQLDRARAEVSALRSIEREVELAVAGRVRSALHAAGASRPAVRLSIQGAEAAEKTLELVRDAYRRGRVDIIRLVDAQTQFLTTQLDAADARFDFYVDFIEVERAMSRYSFGPFAQDSNSFFRELATYAATPSEVAQ